MAIYASLTIMVSSTTKTETAVFKLKVFRVAVLVLVLGLVAFTVSAGVSIDSIDKDIHDDWTVIQSSLNSTRWRGDAAITIVATLQWNRIFVVASCMMLTSLFVFVLVILDKFSNYIENNMHDPIEQSKAWRSLPTGRPPPSP